MATLNTPAEVKAKLLLESENQTMTDEEIQTYLDDAQQEMIDEINRTAERDHFISEEQGTIIFYPFFNVSTISLVKVNNVVIADSLYEISADGDGIAIEDIKIGDIVDTTTQPSNYKRYELAICIVNIRTRLNPFKNNTVDPIYNEWVQKRDNYKKALKSKFGTGLYSG